MNLTKLFVGAFSLSAMLVACDSDSASAKDTEIEELSSSSAVEIASSSSTIRNDSMSSSAIESSSSSVMESSSSSETTQSSSSSENISAGSVYDATAKTLKDLRDGKTYKTVTIGTQTWMAENLNYAYTGVPYKVIGFYVYTSDSTSWCYENDPDNCTKYGRLYTWAAAVGKTEDECGYENECNLPSGNIQGVCPSGWHLPSKAEFETLLEAVGGVQHSEDYWLWQEVGKKLKSTRGWNEYEGESGNETDSFGFSALPAGGRSLNGYYDYEGNFAFFWSSTEYDSNHAYIMSLYYDADSAYLYDYTKYYGYSVRCLKD